MSRANLPLQSCSIARAVAQVGDEWSILIMREMFLGTRRFDDFLCQTRMSSHLLAGRLKKLEAMGVVWREAYSEHPPRSEYRLTAMGRDFWSVIIAFKQWGDRWLGDGEAPVQILHKGCGHLTRPQMTCPDCGQAMAAHDARAALTQSYASERQAARRHT